MSEQEGVVKFAYDLQKNARPANPEQLATLNAWRTMLKQLDMIGQTPDRYDGYGFGNISMRDEQEFIITASQSGGVAHLDQEDYVRISGWNFDRFWVDAEGTKPPSSESLTHAMVYECAENVNFLFHAHCPHIWENARALNIPTTPPEVAYGTPEMAAAFKQLLDDNVSRPIVFATPGHTDGVFSCGPTARDTGGLLVSYLAKAYELSSLL